MIAYKYAGNSGIRILEDLRLKITPPNEFNDPFEIMPISKRSRDLKEMQADAKKGSAYFRGVYEDMARDGVCTGSFDQFQKDMETALPMQHSAYKKLARKEMANRDLATLDEVSSQLGVLCLSNPPDNIPMWSYYGNHHRGVAFGIEIDAIGGQLPGPRGFVNYRKQRVRYDPFGIRAKQQRIQTVFTKSREWRHEQEYRRIFLLADLVSPSPEKDGAKNYFLDISGTAIKEIILGCRVDPALETQIRAELARRKRTFEHVRLFRCERHKSKYELKIVDASIVGQSTERRSSTFSMDPSP